MGKISALLFARLPDRGQVKTRLATGIGDDLALDVYRWLARKQAKALNDSGLSWQLWVTPRGRLEEAALWLPGAEKARDQCEGDLGKRMNDAVEHAFAEGSRGVVLLGTDCPDLDAETLNQLAAWAENGYFAILPAHDGGYAAMAMPKPYPAAFANIEWGSAWVMTRTVAILEKGGNQAILMQPVRDCDTLRDLRDIAERHPDCPYRPEVGSEAETAEIPARTLPRGRE